MNLTDLLPRRRATTGGLALTGIDGNITTTANTVTAWYVLPERPWAFRDDKDRTGWLDAVAAQYAGLAGMRLHLRRTTCPFPTDRWRRNQVTGPLAPRLHITGLPVPVTDPAWAAHVDAAAAHIDAVNPAVGLTMLGVQIPAPVFGGALGGLIGQVLGRGGAATTGEQIEKVSDILAPYGLHAKPATDTALAWLVYRSVGLGLTPPEHRLLKAGPEDILALTEHVQLVKTRWGATVQYVDIHTEETVHTVVLTVGRMEDLDIPERHDPWWHLADQASFPVEISSRVRILGPEEAAAGLNQRLRRIHSQRHDYAEQGIPEPPELERLAARAGVVEDEIRTGAPEQATRAHGVHRIAVSAPSHQECMARANELIGLYRRQGGTALIATKAQEVIGGEFIPGEPDANLGHLRRMSVATFAAAVPQAAAVVGDDRGDLIGWTSTGGRPVMYDPHYACEVVDRSGFVAVIGEPGCGKSTLCGALAYLSARRAVRTTVVDPSGPLAALAEHPDLRGRSRVLDLGSAEPGTLGPYALVPEPRAGDYRTDREYRTAVAAARAERRGLARDVLNMILPAQIARLESTANLLSEAVAAVEPLASATLDLVVKELRNGDGSGRRLARLLDEACEMPSAQLLFGDAPYDANVDADLTVITMPGLRLPDMGEPREYWNAAEAFSVPLLHLANRLAARRCYDGDQRARKAVFLDEIHALVGQPSGRSFLNRLARDSRKRNIAGFLATQNPSDVLDAGLKDMVNLVSTVFVGQVANKDEVVGGALELLQLPADDDGHRKTLASLSAREGHIDYREFVMRDAVGRVQKIRVDVSWIPGLLDLLNTTPGESR